MLDTMLRFISKKVGNLSHLKYQLVTSFAVGCIVGIVTSIIPKIEIVLIDSLEPEFIAFAIIIIVLLLIIAVLKRFA